MKILKSVTNSITNIIKNIVPNRKRISKPNFSPQVKNVIQNSRAEALRLGVDYIGTEHLLLGLIKLDEGTAIMILKKLSIDIGSLKSVIEEVTEIRESIILTRNMPLTKEAEKALKATYWEAKKLENDCVETEHLLVSILKDKDATASLILARFNVNYETFKATFQKNKSDVSAK